MSRDELMAELKWLASYASINQRYHQKMVERFAARDQRTKIALAVFAVTEFSLSLLGFMSDQLTFLGMGPHEASIVSAVFGFLSLSAAFSLTYFGFDAVERSHAESFARWTYLYQDVTTCLQRLKLADDDEIGFLAERLMEFRTKVSEIEKNERPPDRNVLQEAQHDENEHNWGEGIRTEEQVRAERARRRQEEGQQPAAAARTGL